MTAMDILTILTGVFGVSCGVLFAIVMIQRQEYNDWVDGRDEKIEELKKEIRSIKSSGATDREILQSLLRKANERADRNAAIAQGLTEELAALKEYDPDEIEERLKKIREIRAEEERKANEEKLKKSIDLAILNAQLNILAGTPVHIAQQSIYDRLTAANYGVMW